MHNNRYQENLELNTEGVGKGNPGLAGAGGLL